MFETLRQSLNVGLITSTAAIQGGETPGGFAVPLSPNVRRIIDVLKRGEEVDYGFLGIGPESVDHLVEEAASAAEHRLGAGDIGLDGEAFSKEVAGSGGPLGSGELFQQETTRSVDVLVFIHENVLVRAADFLAHVGVFAQKLDWLVDQIAEIQQLRGV